MSFSEEIKLKVKRRSHFMCCLCHALGVEVHHIDPESEGGSDTEDNAAPLCPSCHEAYGANPQKRKFIREARDLWFEICQRRYQSDPERLDEITRMLHEVATKEDLEKAIQILAGNKPKNDVTSNIKYHPSPLPDGLMYIYSERYTIEQTIRGLVIGIGGGWAGCSIAPFENYMEIAEKIPYFPKELLKEITDFYEVTDLIITLGDIPESRIAEINFLAENINYQLQRVAESLPSRNEGEIDPS
jgi:hypothetical protein